MSPQEIAPPHYVTDRVPSKVKPVKRISRNEDYWASHTTLNALVCTVCELKISIT